MFGLDDVAAAMIVTAAVSAVVSAASTAYNGYQTDRTNQQNKDLYNQGLQANKEVAQNGLSWKVTDAKNAGLSPLAALGASTHGNVASTTNPTMQAPQADPSALISSLTSISNEFSNRKTRLDVEKSQASTARGRFWTDSYIAELNRDSNEKIAKARLDFDKAKAENEMSEMIRQYNSTYALDLQKINSANSLQYKMLQTTVDENTAKRLEKIADSQFDMLSTFAKNNGLYIKSVIFPINDEKDLQQWFTLNSDFMDNFTSDNEVAFNAFQAMTDEERYDYVSKVMSKSKGWTAGVNSSGELGNQSGTNETVSERVRGSVKVGKDTKDLIQGKQKGSFNLASVLLKGAGLSGGYNSSESESKTWQKSELERTSRANKYFSDLTYYRPVFKQSFIESYSDRLSYSQIIDKLQKSSFKGYK